MGRALPAQRLLRARQRQVHANGGSGIFGDDPTTEASTTAIIANDDERQDDQALDRGTTVPRAQGGPPEAHDALFCQRGIAGRVDDGEMNVQIPLELCHLLCSRGIDEDHLQGSYHAVIIIRSHAHTADSLVKTPHGRRRILLFVASQGYVVLSRDPNKPYRLDSQAARICQYRRS